MRHGMVNRKLGRTSSHRNAMFRNQLWSLIQNERIVTTLPKAKELRPLIEKLITLGKNDSVHSRRQAAMIIADGALLSKLFDTLGPRFSERPGGYTRIIKLGSRRGDAAEMAILELVGYVLPSAAEAKGTPAASSKAGKKKDAKPAEDAKPAADEKPKKKAAPKKKAGAGDDDKPAKKKAAPAKKKSSK